MFTTVKGKIDRLMEAGFITRYRTAQRAWERLRAREPVLFKLMEGDRAVRQIFAEPDTLGAYFREIPVADDYCRFHEDPIDDEEEGGE